MYYETQSMMDPSAAANAQRSSPPPPSVTPGYLDQAQNALERLHKTIAELCVRLEPVLRASGPDTNANQKAFTEGAPTPFSTAIKGMTHQIERAENGLRELLGRIDL